MLVKTYWAKGIFIRSGLKFGVVIIAESAYSIDENTCVNMQHLLRMKFRVSWLRAIEVLKPHKPRVK